MMAPGMKEPEEGEASESNFHGGAQPSFFGPLAETSTVIHDKKTLKNEDVGKMMKDAEMFMEEGTSATLRRQFEEAADRYSRALEIRIAHFGELAPECVTAYYRYGCALLYKIDKILDSMLEEEEEEEEESNEDCRTTEVKSCSFGNVEKDRSSVAEECATDLEMKGQEETNEGDTDEAIETDEDKSELDLAWKMLDMAMVISEKQQTPTMEKAKIFCALAEVAVERDDIQTALGDYLKAMSILERLVEPNSQHIEELKHAISLCQQFPSNPKEAAMYSYWKVVRICSFQLHCLTETNNSLASPSAVNMSSIPPGRNKMDELAATSIHSPDRETKLKEPDQNHDSFPAHVPLEEDVLDLGIRSAKVRKVGLR